MSKRVPAVALIASRVRSNTNRHFAVRNSLTSRSKVMSIGLRYTSLCLGGAVSLIRVCKTPRARCRLDCSCSLGHSRVNRHFAIGIAMASTNKHRISRSILVAVSKSFRGPAFAVTPNGRIAMLVGSRAGFGLGFAIGSSHVLSCMLVRVPKMRNFRDHHVRTNKRSALDFARGVVLPGRIGDCSIALATISTENGRAIAGDAVDMSRVPSFPGVCLTSITAMRRLGDSVFNMPVIVGRANRCRCHTHCCGGTTNARVFFLPRGASFAPVYFNLSPRSGAGLASSPRATGPVILSRTNICCRVSVGIGRSACDVHACSIARTAGPVGCRCKGPYFSH